MSLFPVSKKAPARLNPEEIDRIVERMIMASSVDPSQVTMNQPTSPDSPELGLHRAILFDAVVCASRHYGSRSSAQRAEARSALRWIESDDESYFLSFVPLCHRFQLNPSWIRRLVRRAIREQSAEATAAAATTAAAA